MCDCYEAKCEIKDCEEKIPIHIADFNFDREEIQVFCNKHLPKEKVTIFENIKIYDKVNGDGFDEDKDSEKIGWRCAIRLCKGKVAPELVGVVPNIYAEYKINILKINKKIGG